MIVDSFICWQERNFYILRQVSNFVTDHALFLAHGKEWTSYLALLTVSERCPKVMNLF